MAYLGITAYSKGRGETSRSDAELARKAGLSPGHFRRQLPILEDQYELITREHIKPDLSNRMTGRRIVVHAELISAEASDDPAREGGARRRAPLTLKTVFKTGMKT